MTKPCPVIFFDVDGPMVPERAVFLQNNIRPRYGWDFDQCAVGMLNFLAWAIPNLRVVIASHRIGMMCPHTTSLETSMKKDWEEIFAYNGLKIQLHDDWVTPRLWDEAPRKKFEEIDDWFKANPTDTFVVIDDEPNGYGEVATTHQRKKYHLVGEDPFDGITHNDFMEMCQYLGLRNFDGAFDKYKKHIATLQASNHVKNRSSPAITVLPPVAGHNCARTY